MQSPTGKFLGRKMWIVDFFFVCDLKPPVLFCLLSLCLCLSLRRYVSDLICPGGPYRRVLLHKYLIYYYIIIT